jgi:integrase/recombinase XerD
MGERVTHAAPSRSRRLDEDVVTPAEIESLLRVCSSRAPTGVRNRAMIAVAWRCGLRIGEVLALWPKDVDVTSATVIVQHGKGDKRRIVGMDAGTCALVDRWLQVRRKYSAGRRSPLFCTLRGGPLDQSYVRHLLPRLAGKAGIDKRVHAHGLRHAYATELEREGARLTTIRDLLGHSSTAVTDRYLRRIGATEAIEFARRRNWESEAGNSKRESLLSKRRDAV